MLYQKIVELLQTLQIPFTEISHEASTSCEHSKSLRADAGLEGAGSKNIVFHAKGNFYLVTTLGDTDIKARNFKHEFGTKDIRFASQDEITEQIGATIGSIPPFGFQNSSLPIFVDTEIFTHRFFCFNPGVADKSIQIATKDLLRVYQSLPNHCKTFHFYDEVKEFLDIEKIHTL